MSTTIIAWILLFAAAQGLFLGTVLLLPASFAGQERRVVNRLIAALVFVFVIIIVDAWYSLTGWYWQVPQLLHASIAFPFLIGPLLLLHLQFMLWQAPFSRAKLWHFLPFLVGILLWSPYYLMSATEKLRLLRSTTEIPWYISIFAAVKLLHMAGYFYLAYRMICEAHRLRPNGQTHSFIVSAGSVSCGRRGQCGPAFFARTFLSGIAVELGYTERDHTDDFCVCTCSQCDSIASQLPSASANSTTTLRRT